MTLPIQGLWIGRELSTMEQLSISSFLQNGHVYHLYTYVPVANVPTGTLMKDANEILPSSMIFQYKDHPSVAGFANLFRYKLLLEKGGYWADLDFVCLRQFDFESEYVFSSEWDDGVIAVNNGIIRAPVLSPVMYWLCEQCQKKDPSQLVWGETGPKLMASALRIHSLERFVLPPPVFCPVSFRDWQQVLESNPKDYLEHRAYAIHLWQEMWRRNAQDKNAHYPADCLYEQLKKHTTILKSGAGQ